MLQVQCAKCRVVLAFEDAMAGRSVDCPDCGTVLDVPIHLKIAEDAGPASVRFVVPAVWMLLDTQTLDLYVDGHQVGDSTIKKGLDVVITMLAGTHTVEIGGKSHSINVPGAGYYEATFEYNRTWGNYSNPPKIKRVPRADTDDWPSQKRDVDLNKLVGSVGEISSEDEAVLLALAQLQEQKATWWGAITTLVISVLLYMGAAQIQDFWDALPLLLPVLAFHELGHYLVMRAFGYRNLRMFFIPFLGAAVTGQHYNIAGWKKALVALAGPVPGIAIGIPIGIAGYSLNEPLLMQIALFLQILNGFNLLPFLPLDGGWVVHSTLFARHPILDLVFRVSAALTVFAMAIYLQAWLMCGIAVLMLISAPFMFRLTRIAHRLGEEGLETRSLDNFTIPENAALRILAELRRFVPKNTAPNVLAQHIANVFEMFNAEPPGILASIGLLALQALAFVAALVTAMLLMSAQGG